MEGSGWPGRAGHSAPPMARKTTGPPGLYHLAALAIPLLFHAINIAQVKVQRRPHFSARPIFWPSVSGLKIPQQFPALLIPGQHIQRGIVIIKNR